MAPLEVSLERNCADKPGYFYEALTREKKFAASLAVGAAHREPFSMVIPCLQGN
jgi:hypothetical protein